MCHSEQGLGTFPNRPDCGELEPGYPIDSPRTAASEVRILGAIAVLTDKDARDAAAVDRSMVARSKYAAATVTKSSEDGHRFGFREGWIASQMATMGEIRKLVEEGHLPTNYAAMVLAFCCGIKAPKSASAKAEPEAETEFYDETPTARECPNCGGEVTYRVRGEDLGWDCDNCGRRHK